ncbi:MAG: hypothetical protein QXX76_07150 [Archaeoglobaceae archaeon]
MKLINLLLIDFLVWVPLFAALFYFFFSLPVDTSLFFALLISIIFDLAYILSKNLRKMGRVPIKKYESIKFFEPLIVVGTTIISYYIGVELFTAFAVGAFAVGGFFLVVYQLYYNNLPHLFHFSSSLMIRRILVFLGFLLAWTRFWNFDLLLSAFKYLWANSYRTRQKDGYRAI